MTLQTTGDESDSLKHFILVMIIQQFALAKRKIFVEQRVEAQLMTFPMTQKRVGWALRCFGALFRFL